MFDNVPNCGQNIKPLWIKISISWTKIPISKAKPRKETMEYLTNKPGMENRTPLPRPARSASEWMIWFGIKSTIVVVGLFLMSTNFAIAQERRESKSTLMPVTFNKDIAPIVHEKCASCHRPGQAGPFSLLIYKDVAKRTRTIDAVIDSGYMMSRRVVNWSRGR
jgi:hypothetical protein